MASESAASGSQDGRAGRAPREWTAGKVRPPILPPPDSVKKRDLWVSLKHLSAGGIAGAVAKTCVAPLELVKLLAQVEGLRHAGAPPRSMRQLVQDVFREDGVVGFWRGNAANVIRIIPNKGIVFFANDKIKAAMLPEGQKHLDSTRVVISGGLSGLVQAVMTYPLDVVRSKLMAPHTSNEYAGIADCVRQTVRQEGAYGLYRGLAPTIFGAVVYTGVSFGTFNEVSKVFMGGGDGEMTTAMTLSAGATAGVISQTVTFPFDTVRRRMQLQDAGEKAQYRSSFHCARKVMRTEGAAAFFRGASANAIRAAPNTAIQFWCVSELKKLFMV